jgi:hypothetical protein
MHLSFVNKVTNFLDHGIGTCLPILFSPKHQKYHPVFIKEGREDFIPTKKKLPQIKPLHLVITTNGLRCQPMN